MDKNNKKAKDKKEEGNKNVIKENIVENVSNDYENLTFRLLKYTNFLYFLKIKKN
jgi:hypothetical protein